MQIICWLVVKKFLQFWTGGAGVTCKQPKRLLQKNTYTAQISETVVQIHANLVLLFGAISFLKKCSFVLGGAEETSRQHRPEMFDFSANFIF